MFLSACARITQMLMFPQPVYKLHEVKIISLSPLFPLRGQNMQILNKHWLNKRRNKWIKRLTD